MKLYLYTLLLLLSFNIILAQNVKIEDYQKAESQAKILRFNGLWNWAQKGDSVTADIAKLNVFFKAFYSSLPLAWFIDLNLSGFKDKSDYTHNVNLALTGRKYILEDYDFFAFARLNAEHASKFERVASKITFGGGYGRNIDATALAKAVRIEEHLIKEKILTSNLPKNTMIKIANIIEREDEYKNLYGDIYETFWISDIEKEIIAAGTIKATSIGALGILRIRQVLFKIYEIVNQRSYGWDISSGLSYELSRSDNIPTGSPRLNISGSYSYPLSWRFHINHSSSFDTPIDSSFFKAYTLRGSVDFIYELSNRINFVTSYDIKLQKEFGSNTFLTHDFNTAFNFYIENSIILGVNATVQQIQDKPRNLSFSLNIQYNVF